MIDYDVLASVGTTDERLKEIFTAQPYEDTANVTEEQRKERDLDLAVKKKFEDRIMARLTQHMTFSLQNHSKFSAVDLAWDSVPINRAAYPLLLYAQGKLDLGACSNELSKLKCADQYVRKDEKGNVTGLDLPRFLEVNINLVRSIITRRLAAQSNKYQNLYPAYRYESRSTSLVGKLRADIMSQRMDIMADQYDYRHHEIQVARDMMLYARSTDFMRSSWEREIQWVKVNPAEEFKLGSPLEKKAVIVKEGAVFVNTHPSRTFIDNAYPAISLNTDSGCEYCGNWDVVRYKDIKHDPHYWNRDKVTFSSNVLTLFQTYSTYFTNYYCTINAPAPNFFATDLSSNNDRRNNIGLYSQANEDSSMVFANYFEKLIPAEHRIGTYPYPIWIRCVVGGDNTVLFSEIMPTTPAAVASYNENDSRQLNISLAHQMIPYQDQLTNLFSYLLLVTQTQNVKIVVINTDVVTSPEDQKKFEDQARGKNFYAEPLVLKVSGIKMSEIGVEIEKAVQMIEARSSVAINIIFQAILQLLQMVERLEALSPQEQGQPAPREISATETNLIAGTTESVYGFISDAIDEYRAAKKRMLYEAYMAKGDQNIRLPIANRYSANVIRAAGFDLDNSEVEEFQDPNRPYVHTIIGTKSKLIHDYIFTSRDGAERSTNTQSANVLTQLLGVLSDPVVRQALGRQKLFDIINEIFRMSGSGVDLRLELKEGESDAIGIDPNAQVQSLLEQLTERAERNSQEIQMLRDDFARLAQSLLKAA